MLFILIYGCSKTILYLKPFSKLSVQQPKGYKSVIKPKLKFKDFQPRVLLLIIHSEPPMRFLFRLFSLPLKVPFHYFPVWRILWTEVKMLKIIPIFIFKIVLVAGISLLHPSQKLIPIPALTKLNLLIAMLLPFRRRLIPGGIICMAVRILHQSVHAVNDMLPSSGWLQTLLRKRQPSINVFLETALVT